jgi:hypothetical protein
MLGLKARKAKKVQKKMLKKEITVVRNVAKLQKIS